MMQQQSSIKYTSAAIVWTLMMLYSFFKRVEDLNVPKTFLFPGGDKVVHFVLFAMLTFLIVKALRERRLVFRSWILFIALSAFGLFTEIIQHFLSYRNGDILDLFADVAGVLFTLLIIKILR